MNTVKWTPERLIAEVNMKSDRLLDLMSEDVLQVSKDEAPVDTGNLQASIRMEKDYSEKIASVGSDLDYALFVEYGTRYQEAQPYLRPALDGLNGKVDGMISQVSTL